MLKLLDDSDAVESCRMQLFWLWVGWTSTLVSGRLGFRQQAKEIALVVWFRITDFNSRHQRFKKSLTCNFFYIFPAQVLLEQIAAVKPSITMVNDRSTSIKYSHPGPLSHHLILGPRLRYLGIPV